MHNCYLQVNVIEVPVEGDFFPKWLVAHCADKVPDLQVNLLEVPVEVAFLPEWLIALCADKVPNLQVNHIEVNVEAAFVPEWLIAHCADKVPDLLVDGPETEKFKLTLKRRQNLKTSIILDVRTSSKSYSYIMALIQFFLMRSFRFPV